MTVLVEGVVLATMALLIGIAGIAVCIVGLVGILLIIDPGPMRRRAVGLAMVWLVLVVFGVATRIDPS